MSRAAVTASNARSLYISLRWHCVGSPRGCLCITADGCHGNRCLHVLPGSPTHPQTPTHPKHARAQDRLRLKRRGTVGKVERMFFNSCFSCPFPLQRCQRALRHNQVSLRYFYLVFEAHVPSSNTIRQVDSAAVGVLYASQWRKASNDIKVTMQQCATAETVRFSFCDRFK